MRSVRRGLPVVLLVASACFASRNDVRLLQSDLRARSAETQARMDSARAAQARSDSAMRAMMASAIVNLAHLGDSLQVLSMRTTQNRVDVSESLLEIRSQMLQLQLALGSNAEEMRGFLTKYEADRTDIMNQSAPGATPGVASAATMLQTGNAQYEAGRYVAARSAYQELLTQYPTSEQACPALHGIGLTYYDEQNWRAADSVFTGVVKLPKCSRVSNALWKLANVQLKANRPADAGATLDRIVREFPSSAEADLAKELRRQIPPLLRR